MGKHAPPIALSNIAATASRCLYTSKGFSVEHVLLPDDNGFEYEWTSNLHYCALHDIRLKNGELKAEDGTISRIRDLRDLLTYVPPEQGIRGWSEPLQRSNAYTAFYFQPELLHQELDHRYSASAIRSRIYFRDTQIAAALAELAALVRKGDPDPLLMETMALLLALRLGAPGHSGTTSNGLAPGAITRIFDFIEANLAAPITLEEMAALSGLSRFHFARQFKLATGQTPYQTVMDRRLTRAGELLADTDTPVEEIARSTGYRSASHFSQLFARHRGLSPQQFRREHRR